MKKLYNAIYAGQTTNLRQRFQNHVQGYGNLIQAKNTFRRLDFWFTSVRSAELDEIEQLLLDTLGPTANIINVKARIGEPMPAGRTTGAKK